MAKLRIAFSGIGAVGGYYGGMVAARYQGTIKADIFFIARGDKNAQKEFFSPTHGKKSSKKFVNHNKLLYICE